MVRAGEGAGGREGQGCARAPAVCPCVRLRLRSRVLRVCMHICVCVCAGPGREAERARAVMSEAIVWLRRGSEGGQGDAGFYLGVLYEQGVLFPPDPHVAYMYYKAAADGPRVRWWGVLGIGEGPWMRSLSTAAVPACTYRLTCLLLCASLRVSLHRVRACACVRAAGPRQGEPARGGHAVQREGVRHGQGRRRGVLREGSRGGGVRGMYVSLSVSHSVSQSVSQSGSRSAYQEGKSSINHFHPH
jgi:hypothetical protein